MVYRHPDTERLVHECSRCGEVLNPDGAPAETHAVYYVTADEERNPFTVEMWVGLRHTDETRAVRRQIIEEHDLTIGQANNALLRQDPGLMPEGVAPPLEEDYERVEDIEPEVEKFTEEVLTVFAEEVEVDRPARLLICEECKREGDGVIWAGDAVS